MESDPEWFRRIERCMNSDDSEIRRHANKLFRGRVRNRYRAHIDAARRYNRGTTAHVRNYVRSIGARANPRYNI